MLSVFVLALPGCEDGPTSSPDGSSARGESSPRDPGEIDTARGKELIAQGALILDVRSPGEFEAGAYAGAKLVPHDQVSGKLGEIESWLGGDKSKPIVVYCRSGRRSGIAARELAEAGFNVVNAGGLGDLQ